MTLREILDLVVQTPPTGWHVARGWRALTPIHLYEHTSACSAPATHNHLAVHREHPEVSIAWGLSFGLIDFPMTTWDPGDDVMLETVAAQVLLNGAVVHSDELLTVVRVSQAPIVFLPLPMGVAVETGEYSHEVAAETISSWEAALGRLVDVLSGHTDFDRWRNASGFIEVERHPLDD
jgi:hypothetical protein